MIAGKDIARSVRRASVENKAERKKEMSCICLRVLRKDRFPSAHLNIYRFGR